MKQLKGFFLSFVIGAFALILGGLCLLGFGVILITTYFNNLTNDVRVEQLMLFFIGIYLLFGFILLLLGVRFCLHFSKKIDKYMLENQREQIIQTDSPNSHLSSRKMESLQIIRATMPTSQDRKQKVSPISQSSSLTQNGMKSEIHTKTIAIPQKKPTDTAKSPTLTYSEGLQSIVDRYNTDKVRKAFKKWYNTFMITFPDISKSFLFKIRGSEGVEFSEGFDETAAVQVKMDSEIFAKMMSKQINPIKAYSSGNLEVKGEMKNMLKLRKLMF